MWGGLRSELFGEQFAPESIEGRLRSDLFKTFAVERVVSRPDGSFLIAGGEGKEDGADGFFCGAAIRAGDASSG